MSAVNTTVAFATASQVISKDDTETSTLSPQSSLYSISTKLKSFGASRSMDTWLDKMTKEEADFHNKNLAKVFYRTAIPFRVADTEEFKNLIKGVRPAFGLMVPSARLLGGTMIDEDNFKFNVL